MAECLCYCMRLFSRLLMLITWYIWSWAGDSEVYLLDDNLSSATGWSRLAKEQLMKQLRNSRIMSSLRAILGNIGLLICYLMHRVKKRETINHRQGTECYSYMRRSYYKLKYIKPYPGSRILLSLTELEMSPMHDRVLSWFIICMLFKGLTEGPR